MPNPKTSTRISAAIHAVTAILILNDNLDVHIGVRRATINAAMINNRRTLRNVFDKRCLCEFKNFFLVSFNHSVILCKLKATNTSGMQIAALIVTK